MAAIMASMTERDTQIDAERAVSSRQGFQTSLLPTVAICEEQHGHGQAKAKMQIKKTKSQKEKTYEAILRRLERIERNLVAAESVDKDTGIDVADASKKVVDALIIGGGIVGLATARAPTQ